MLLLLPNLLGENRHHQLFLPASIDKAMKSIDGLIAESESGARRFLSHFEMDKKPHEVPVALYNEEDIDFILEPLAKGERWGFVSDAGLPCIADPGHKLVARARARGIPIQAFVGPSAIMLALMQSGLPGQHFTFHGYIGKEAAQRKMELTKMESQPGTHIFIEAPHRNKHTLESLLESLSPETRLCIAWDLTLPTQGIITEPVRVWQKMALPNIDKKPAIFLFSK